MNGNIKKIDTYCIDADALIDLKNNYPLDVFPALWMNIEFLIRQGRLIAPAAVRKEIERGTDMLVPWAKKQSKMFFKPTSNQLSIVRKVLSKFPGLADPNAIYDKADPFLIALAIEKGDLFGPCVVISHEKSTKVPRACKTFSIECIRLPELFEREGWEFNQAN